MSSAEAPAARELGHDQKREWDDADSGTCRRSSKEPSCFPARTGEWEQCCIGISNLEGTEGEGGTEEGKRAFRLNKVLSKNLWSKNRPFALGGKRGRRVMKQGEENPIRVFKRHLQQRRAIPLESLFRHFFEITDYTGYELHGWSGIRGL